MRFRSIAISEFAILNTGERLFFDILFIIGLAPLPLWFFVHHGAWDGAFWCTFKHLDVPILLVVAVGSRLFMPPFWAETGWLARGFLIHPLRSHAHVQGAGSRVCDQPVVWRVGTRGDLRYHAGQVP